MRSSESHDGQQFQSGESAWQAFFRHLKPAPAGSLRDSAMAIPTQS